MDLDDSYELDSYPKRAQEEVHDAVYDIFFMMIVCHIITIFRIVRENL